MDLGLKGKTVLITGGSKGIGFAVAQMFASEGANLHIAARGVSELEEAKRKLATYGVKVTTHAADLSASSALNKLAEDAGDIDVLINNAGSIPNGRFDAIDEETWRHAWDLKVFGYINMTRAVYGKMRQRGAGVIVNIIGLGGERHRPQYIAGSSGNSALMAFTRALGSESVDHGVRIVGINPGRVLTDRQIEHLRISAKEKFGDPERWKDFHDEAAKTLPFGRFIKPEDVADMVVFLASERASYMSATVVTLDGGQSLRPRV